MERLSRREWIGLVLIGLAMTSFAIYPRVKKISSSPEIEKIKTLKSVSEQSKELTKLLERVGPVETQEQMLRSGLPFTGETHLLIHTIGTYTYDKYGLGGLSYCRDYFLSACYHGFIINALADNGLNGVAEAIESCETAGIGVAPQCAHAAGHGFLAWHDYDLLKALQMCDALGEKVSNFYYFNCYDGTFMENIWGVHNGVPSEKRWLKDSDIYYPCTDPRIADKYLRGCWSNQATRIYQFYKQDLKKTAEACDAVIHPGYKETCYNNFARQIHPLTKDDNAKVLSLCSYATGENWKNYCILTILTSAWSVGNRTNVFELCPLLADPVQANCFSRLVDQIIYYYPDKNTRKIYCLKVSSPTHKTRCLDA